MKKGPHGSKNKGPSGPPLKSKPFCDCRKCACNECPDILHLLGIQVTETSCDFGSKVPKGKKQKAEEDRIALTPSLLAVMNGDRDCACEIMARTVRSDVHMNMGLTHRRDALIASIDSDSSTPSQTSIPHHQQNKN